MVRDALVAIDADLAVGLGFHGKFTDMGSNPLVVHVHHLRLKLGNNLIKTVRGIGYTIGAET